jgi:hypothetical protein
MNQYYFDIIPLNNIKHSYDTAPYLYYLRNITTNDYTLDENLDTNLFQTSIIYCYNKKSLLQLFTKTNSNIDLRNIFDINFLIDVPIKFEINSINIYDFWYNGENKHDDNVNKYIPNIKHLEYLEQKYINFEQILLNLEPNFNSNYIKFYNRFIQVFANLEKYEINFNKKKIHSNYNLYNTYSRPTNVSGKINFTALSKKDESLKKFVPNNTIFVEFDYTSYQIHLLYDLLDVKHSTDVYQDLCKLYQSDDRDFVKKQSMYYMFGEIDTNPFPKNEFFTKLFQLKNLIKSMDEFISPISGKIIKLKQDSGDISKILQIIETEKNVSILEHIEKYLNQKLTKLVLYKYDAFLFDFDENDGMDTLHDLHEIIEQNGACSVKFGKNYFEICN